MLIENIYKMNKCSADVLKSHGFIFDKVKSHGGKKYYSYKFPAMKYNDHASLVGEIKRMVA